MKNIDCLLIYPTPTQDSPKRGLALGIFYCGAALERAGLNVEYFDARFDDEEKLARLIRRKPLAVGVSTMTGYQLLEAKRYLTWVKKEDPSIHTIMGGVHPSILPMESLKEDFVDFVVVGEGESVLPELINALKGQGRFAAVRGLCWKDNGRLTQNERAPFMDMASAPFPLTEKTQRYYAISAASNDIIHPTSRSCPGFCGFCYNLVVNKSQWRPMPEEKWKKEFDDIASAFRFSHMFTGDDNIGRDKARIKRIGDAFKKRNITWHTNIRPEYLDEELVKILDERGCTSVLMGYESGSDRVLKEVIRKGLPNGSADLRRTAELLGASRNIRAIYSFMSNLPTETWQELKESMDLADYIKKMDNKARVTFYVYGPYPGTTMYHMALKDGFREPRTIEEWSRVSLSNDANPVTENLYYIAGLTFRGSKGDNTSVNFPGWKRLIIAPFELSAKIRWRARFFRFYGFEKAVVKRLFRWAAGRANRRAKRTSDDANKN